MHRHRITPALAGSVPGVGRGGGRAISKNTDGTGMMGTVDATTMMTMTAVIAVVAVTGRLFYWKNVAGFLVLVNSETLLRTECLFRATSL